MRTDGQEDYSIAYHEIMLVRTRNNSPRHGLLCRPKNTSQMMKYDEELKKNLWEREEWSKQVMKVVSTSN